MRAVPAAERIRRLLADAAPEIQALGLEPHLRPLERMLDEGNCAQRPSAGCTRAARRSRRRSPSEVRDDTRVGRWAGEELEATHG